MYNRTPNPRYHPWNHRKLQTDTGHDMDVRNSLPISVPFVKKQPYKSWSLIICIGKNTLLTFWNLFFPWQDRIFHLFKRSWQTDPLDPCGEDTWQGSSRETECRLDHPSGRPCVKGIRMGLAIVEHWGASKGFRLPASLLLSGVSPPPCSCSQLVFARVTSDKPPHLGLCSLWPEMGWVCKSDNLGGEVRQWRRSSFARNPSLRAGPARKPNELTALSACGSQVEAWRTIGWGHSSRHQTTGIRVRRTNEGLFKNVPRKGHP